MEREDLLLKAEQIKCKTHVLSNFYNPEAALAPEMSFNLGRKTYKEYLEMKRKSTLKNDGQDGLNVTNPKEVSTEKHLPKAKKDTKAKDKIKKTTTKLLDR